MRKDSAKFRPVLPSAREETGGKASAPGFQEDGHREERNVCLLREEDLPVLHRETHRTAKEIAADYRAVVPLQGVLPGDGQAGTVISPSPAGNDRRGPVGACDDGYRPVFGVWTGEGGVAGQGKGCRSVRGVPGEGSAGILLNIFAILQERAPIKMEITII